MAMECLLGHRSVVPGRDRLKPIVGGTRYFFDKGYRHCHLLLHQNGVIVLYSLGICNGAAAHANVAEVMLSPK